jgi:hypothetical protein
MKRLYTLSVCLSIFLFYGCSKDFLKSYDTRIIGTWRISDVNRIGFGGSTSNLPFTSGTFTFYSNGTLDYLSATSGIYKGTWDIVKKTIGEETLRSLQITAVDFTNQQVLSQYYDDMNFVSTNHFKVTINSNFHTYVTHFKR